MPVPTRIAAAAVLTVVATTTAAGLPSADAAPARHTAATDKGPVTSTVEIAKSSSVAQSAISTVDALGVGAGQGLAVRNAFQDDTGATHVRLTRTFHGLRVVGGDLVVHRSAAGALLGTTQGSTAPLTMATTPTLTATKIKAAFAQQTAKPELVVDAVGHAPRLAWLVTTGGTQADGTPSRLEHYVDATSGKTLRTEQTIETVDGDGSSLYLGTVPLDLTGSGSTYQLKSTSRGGTYTSDAGNKTDGALCSVLAIGCATSTLFTSPDTHFGDGTTGSRESAAVDAQRGSDLTWDYYKNVFGRNGIFGTGKGSYNRVHYGQNYVNAFWDGEKMTYGDGDGAQYGPLTSVDVTGHEMSHGVTENTAGLTYSGESGGLNEATSDIFGTMVEFYANDAADPGDYLIGEQFDKTGKGLRRMDDPATDGASQSCWSADTKNVDVHYSSGVGNHFFYLLAEGSGAKTLNGVSYSSPTCGGAPAVSGIGRDDAAAIWYRALTVYFTSGTTYAQARTATVDAANDLYGAGSTQSAAVAKAWSAVNVT